ncbi:MAG: 50S ribosomal protein L9 [Actinobacteria bacterium]|nr:50S ribosomal protein L9 [Actinomycetota bacterium]
MKVVLTQDFEKLGSLGDVVNVKDGYAKNFLIPNKIALPATKGNLKQVEIIKRSVTKREARNIKEAQEIAERLKDLTLVFKVRASQDGKLYGSVTSKDIADKILEERKVEVDKKKIELEDHIKELGEYEIEIKLYKGINSSVRVVIESEMAEGEGVESEKDRSDRKKLDDMGESQGREVEDLETE